jgi:hypothetical protein
VHGPPYSQTPIYTLYPNSEPLGVLTGRGAKFPRAHRDGPNQSPVEVAQVAGWAICLALQPTPDSSQILCCQIPPRSHCRVPTAGRPPGRAARAIRRFWRINLGARAGQGEKPRNLTPSRNPRAPKLPARHRRRRCRFRSRWRGSKPPTATS